MHRPVIQTRLELLPVRDVAEELGVSIQTVYRRIEDGTLNGYKIGPHATLVARADLERFKAGIGA